MHLHALIALAAVIAAPLASAQATAQLSGRVTDTSGAVLPGVTMRTYSEGKRSGTIELLLTSPITDFEIIMGKFVGALGLYALMLAVTFVHVGVLFAYGSPELKPLLAESWRNLNPNTWEIKLRRGVRFTNGEEFTGEVTRFGPGEYPDLGPEWTKRASSFMCVQP